MNVEEEVVRKELVERLYRHHKGDYRDATRYRTGKALARRVALLRAKMSTTPQERQTSANLKYKKLALEHALLHWKLQIYQTTGASPPLVEFWRLQLQETDQPYVTIKRTNAQRKANKDRQMKLLLHISLRDKSCNEIRALVDQRNA